MLGHRRPISPSGAVPRWCRPNWPEPLKIWISVPAVIYDFRRGERLLHRECGQTLSGGICSFFVFVSVSVPVPLSSTRRYCFLWAYMFPGLTAQLGPSTTFTHFGPGAARITQKQVIAFVSLMSDTTSNQDYDSSHRKKQTGIMTPFPPLSHPSRRLLNATTPWAAQTSPREPNCTAGKHHPRSPAQ